MARYIVSSAKPFEAVCQDLATRVAAHKFGVLHVHDLRATMNAKGVPFEKNVRIFEVCNPIKARQVLDTNLMYNMGLPCRISVWEESGAVHVGMINPSALMSLLSEDPSLKPVADEVEHIMREIIDESAV